MSFSVPSVPPTPNTYDPKTLVGRRLVDTLGPWMTLHLAWYVDAIGASFDEVARLVTDQAVDGQFDYVPGYGTLMDPERATGSQLRFLGQFVGVPIAQGTTDDEARRQVDAEAGLKRGTPASIITAAKSQLSGAQQVRLVERKQADGTPNPYWFVIIVRTRELINQQALVDAVNRVKPGGLMWTLIIADGFAWLEAIHEWATETDGSGFLSWADVAHVQP